MLILGSVGPKRKLSREDSAAMSYSVMGRMAIQDIFNAKVNTNYAEGIRSYRLSGERIFNIELEETSLSDLLADQNKNKRTDYGIVQACH